MKRLVLAVVIVGFFFPFSGFVQAQGPATLGNGLQQAPTSSLYLVPAQTAGLEDTLSIHNYGDFRLMRLSDSVNPGQSRSPRWIPVEGVERIQYRSWEGSYQSVSGVSTEGPAEVGLLALVGPVDALWIQHIESGGVEILDRAPPYGLVVSATSAELAACLMIETSQGFQVVRGWIPMPVEAEISSDLMPIATGERGPGEIPGLMLGPAGSAYVRVFPYSNEDRDEVLERVSQFAPRVRVLPPYGHDNVFEVNGPEILDIVETLSGVAFVEGVYERKLHNNLAVQDYIMNVEPVWNDLGWDGTGVIVDHNDSGADLNHPDLAGIILATNGAMSNTDNGHGTHTAGSVAGRGIAGTSPTNTSGCGDQNPPLNLIKGSAPGANLVVNNIFDGGSTSEDLMMRWGSQQGALLSTNSWSYDSYDYLSYAAVVDARVRDADTTAGGNQELAIVFSAGNDGPASSTIGTPGNGKNTLTVGASQNDRCGSYIPSQCAGPDIDTMACFSARGPAQGRILPDVVGVGADVISVESADSQATYPWDESWTGSDYALSPGTSMSCPLVAGAAAVFYEFYFATFAEEPSPALVKAAMINGAVDMGYGYPSYDQGWGRVDLRRSIEGPPGGEIKFVDQSSITPLSTGGSWSQPFTVSSSAIPLKITVDWTDPPGTANCSSCLVNDLDLVVTSPSGTVYKGNQFTSNWATENPGGKDDVNNVENVFIQAPETGNWTIEIVSANTSQNPPGLLGQDFALVYSGTFCDAVPPTGLTANPNGDNRIDLSWNSAAGATEYRIYRSTTSGGPYSQVGTVSAPTTSYCDTTVSGGVTYFFVVRNFTICESADSSEASATTTGTCTEAPAFAGITSATNGSVDDPCTINLEWNPATAMCAGPITYRVFRDISSGFTPGGGNQIAGGVTCSKLPCIYSDIDTLVGGTPYYYVVRAYDASSAAEDSNTVEATATPSGSTPVGTLAYEDDFDGNRPAGAADYWIEAYFDTDDDDNEELALNTSRSRSTTTSYKFGGVGTGDYSSNEDNGLSLGGDGSGVTNGFVIPADATNIRLRFWHTYEFQPGSDGALLYYSVSEWSSVTYIDDVVSTTEPYISSGGYTGSVDGLGAWDDVTIPNFSEVVVNCDAMAGETLWFLWRFITNGNQNREGYYLDDVTLTYDVPAPCTTFNCTDPGAVTIDSITDDDACVQDGVTITFSGGAGASRFDLWVDGSRVASEIEPSPYSYDPGDPGSHSYVVRAANGCCHTDSAPSNFTDNDYRPTFGGLQTVAAMPNNACGLRLEWNAASSSCFGGPMVYNVYRDTTSGFTPNGTTLLASCVTDLEYEDTAVGGGTTYYYVVRAEDSTLGHGGPCGSGYEDTNTTEVGGTPSGGLATLYSENFDAYSAGDSADWAHDVVSGSDYWEDVRACPANSAPNVYRFGSDSCSGNYHSDSDALAYPLPGGSPISVPPGATGVSLSFAHDWDFAAGDGASLWLASATTYPSFYYIGGAYLSGQGYTGTVDGNDGFVGSSGGFATTQVDLSQFCTDDANFAGDCSGEDLYVAFNAFSDVMSSLYDQGVNPNGGKSCQDFEAANDAYDSEGAADFVVPAGGWVIEGVDIPGSYSTTGPLDSLDVIIYSDSGGFPGAVVCSNMNVGGTNLVDNSGDLEATLPTPCDLPVGTYWLGIQGNMDYGSGGQWYWTMDAVQSTGYEGVWRNPGNGFGTGCTSWTYLTTCDPGSDPDYVFTLHGRLPAGTGWNLDDVELTYGSGGACSGAPDPVQQFTARSTSGAVKLEWQNPDDVTYSTTRICVDTVGFPTNPGTTAVPGCTLAGSDRNGGLGNYDTMAFAGSNGTTYYFAAFVDNGSGEYSASKTVKARPFDTSATQVEWAYSTGASALAPPGLYPGALDEGAVYGVSNDRVLHGMNSTAGGGDWPRTVPFDWMPMGMNGPAQSRPPIVPTTVIPGADLVAFLGSQDGHVYAVNAKSGVTLWQSADNYGLVQGAPAGMFTRYGGAYDLLFAGSRVAGSGNSMFGLSPSTGANLWEYGGTIGIISAGATVDYANNLLYFASRENPGVNENTLWCLHFEYNDPTWTITEVWSQAYGDIDSAPVLFDGVLYVGTNAGVVMAVDPATGARNWKHATNDGPVKGYVDFEFITGTPRRLFFATTTSVWALTDNGASVAFEWQQAGVGGPSIPLTLADEGAMYVGSTDGRLYQLNPTTGGIVTSVPMGDETATVGSPGYDWMNSLAYVGAEDGSVYAVTLPLQ